MLGRRAHSPGTDEEKIEKTIKVLLTVVVVGKRARGQLTSPSNANDGSGQGDKAEAAEEDEDEVSKSNCLNN